MYEDDGSGAHQHDAHSEGGAWKGETAFQQPGVPHLQIVERLFAGVGLVLAADALVNHHIL